MQAGEGLGWWEAAQKARAPSPPIMNTAKRANNVRFCAFVEVLAMLTTGHSS
jgi:hypothetical protein